jgi:AbrB family looped-hinge helix DNA binding protein
MGMSIPKKDIFASFLSKVTNQGRLTIPKNVRDIYDLKTGDVLRVTLSNKEGKT